MARHGTGSRGHPLNRCRPHCPFRFCPYLYQHLLWLRDLTSPSLSCGNLRIFSCSHQTPDHETCTAGADSVHHHFPDFGDYHALVLGRGEGVRMARVRILVGGRCPHLPHIEQVRRLMHRTPNEESRPQGFDLLNCYSILSILR